MKIKDIFGLNIPLFENILLDSELQQKLSAIDGFSARNLDLLWLKRSLDKETSILWDLLALRDGSDEESEYYQSSFAEMVQTIITMNKHNWLKLIDSYNYEYDALKPYSMNVNDKVISDHLESTENRDGSTESSDTSTTSYQGFNSTNFSDTDKDLSGSSSSSESSNVYERDNTSEREITREGNIGNKTIPQLIREQRELLTINLYNSLFSDIDKVLCARLWSTKI